MPPTYGHRRGANVIDMAVRHLFGRGVSTISLFAFSSENWNRSGDEVDFLMQLIETELPRQVDAAAKEGARIRFIGRRDRLSPSIVKIFEKAEADTAANAKGTIVFAIDYGGRDEILRAANAAVSRGETVDSEKFESFMDSGDLPPIDLAVRTSGEQRISNFMLWKLAYAEFLFIKRDWPGISKRILDGILADFAKRKRRFGK
jgi:undecaprenyl diphosphate synthase